MPKPVYIICSESGSEDRNTGLFSHFNVLEQIELRAVPDPEPDKPVVIVAQGFQVVSVWLQGEGDDPGQSFECEMIFYMPDGNKIVAASTRFTFEKPRFRIVVRASGIIFQRAGLFIAESRVRRFGDEEDPWVSQYYELHIMMIMDDSLAS